jgi:hypothetical protein
MTTNTQQVWCAVDHFAGDYELRSFVHQDFDVPPADVGQSFDFICSWRLHDIQLGYGQVNPLQDGPFELRLGFNTVYQAYISNLQGYDKNGPAPWGPNLRNVQFDLTIMFPDPPPFTKHVIVPLYWIGDRYFYQPYSC